MVMRPSRRTDLDGLVRLSQLLLLPILETFHHTSTSMSIRQVKKEQGILSKLSLTLSKAAAENNLHQSYI